LDAAELVVLEVAAGAEGAEVLGPEVVEVLVEVGAVDEAPSAARAPWWMPQFSQ
jgi:hypothetical protein